MYAKSAPFYDALYRTKDYEAAVRQLRAVIDRYVPSARSLLDVACGTGKHLEHLQHHYTVEGVDISPPMLEVARRRLPGVPLHVGDMVDFDLGRTFDVVTCLFSSIGSVKTLDNLHRAVGCLTRHLAPGGVLVVEPWFSPDNYRVGPVTINVVDEPGLKIAWMYTAEVDGQTSIIDIHYLVGTPDGVEHFVERREAGLFTHDEYLGALEQADLDVDYDSQGLFGRGMYVGVRRPS
jgi:ubiquinone/menaquinone biosynthesis C-methylase UbiE